MLLNDTWWNCEGHMMDVGMYVDSLHNTRSRAFVSGNKVMFCMVYPHLCKYSLDPSLAQPDSDKRVWLRMTNLDPRPSWLRPAGSAWGLD